VCWWKSLHEEEADSHLRPVGVWVVAEQRSRVADDATGQLPPGHLLPPNNSPRKLPDICCWLGLGFRILGFAFKVRGRSDSLGLSLVFGIPGIGLWVRVSVRVRVELLRTKIELGVKVYG